MVGSECIERVEDQQWQCHVHTLVEDLCPAEGAIGGVPGWLIPGTSLERDRAYGGGEGERSRKDSLQISSVLYIASSHSSEARHSSCSFTMSAAASIVSRDSAAESTHSSIIGAKASKLKSKLKSKLHRKHDGDHEDGDEDDGDEYDEDEGELGDGAVVRVRSRASEVGVDGGPTMQAATPAQAYAAANTPHVGDGVAATDYVSPANAAGSRVSASYTGAPGTPGRGESRTHLDGSLTSHGEVSYRDRSKSSSGATLPATQVGGVQGCRDSRGIQGLLCSCRIQSNWKREAEFHNLFEGIDEDEQLVSDYSSAWAKDVRAALWYCSDPAI